MAQWALPLDAYQNDEGGNEAYAEQLLVGGCLESQGISWPVAYQPEQADGNGNTASNGRTLFSSDIAQRFGYHQARTIDLPGFEKAREIEEVPRELSASEDEAFTQCLRQARQKMGTEDPLPQLSQEFAVEPYDESERSAPVRAAAKKWVTCMKPLGISDLGSSPSEMPSDSLAKRFGLAGDGNTSPKPHSDEIAIAVKDASCRTSSGWTHVLYDTEYERQLPVVAKHADELNRLRIQIKARQERVHQVIADNAPAR
ncbi:hypothetical protein GCM10025867_18920 [Frondihabitans sucicola]|uniref:Uncharacterized protein n=2 Tax=Frondihabitans sucicola TaxID=1268041 RepID=A0ABN6Y0Z2_9MICO|nr:hypothetical protein GCM10025867_18920 [Frondihabitans sucicola]